MQEYITQFEKRRGKWGKYYSGAVLIEKQWTGMINISKLDQLIILPSATLKSKLDTQKGIVFAAF